MQLTHNDFVPIREFSTAPWRPKIKKIPILYTIGPATIQQVIPQPNPKTNAWLFDANARFCRRFNNTVCSLHAQNALRLSDGSPLLGVQRRDTHHVNVCSAVKKTFSVLGSYRQALCSGLRRKMSSEEIGVLDTIIMTFDLEEFFVRFASLMSGRFFLLFVSFC